MRSRRTGSRNIKTLPPTLPPATSTCVRTVNLSPSRFRHRRDVVDFRTDGNGAGRHHDDRSVRQPQLLLPARKRGLKNYRPTRTPGSRCISIDGGLARFDSSGARARAAPTPHGRAARSERAAIEAGGRALKNYLRERAAGAARHDVDRSSAWPANACAGAVDGLMSRGRVAARGEGARRRRGDLRWSGPRPCPRPGLRCWAPAPPGRCSRSSRAPRSCGCPRPSPWSLRRACVDDSRRRSFCALRFFLVANCHFWALFSQVDGAVALESPGDLGEQVLPSSYSLETPATRRRTDGEGRRCGAAYGPTRRAATVPWPPRGPARPQARKLIWVVKNLITLVTPRPPRGGGASSRPPRRSRPARRCRRGRPRSRAGPSTGSSPP